jgi:IclR family transcriptional regulator, pca regulon regulatory protein
MLTISIEETEFQSMKHPSHPVDKPDSRYSIEALTRGLEILELFTHARPTLSLTEIVDALGLAKSTAFRVLSTLEASGYIDRNPVSKRYRPSLKVLRLGFTALHNLEIRQIARPHLERLAQTVEETVSLAVLEGMKVTYVDRIRNRAIVGVILGIGSQLPAHCTALGKVLLADLSIPELRQRMADADLAAFTAKTITDPLILENCLSAIKRNGYAEDDEELAIGLRAAAAPIRDASGCAVAAVNVSGSVTTIDHHRLKTVIVPAVIRTAEAIGMALYIAP